MRDRDDIVNTYATRERAQQPVMAKRLETKEVYENEFDVPLPELQREEKPAVPNLLQTGIDQLATRASSTMPLPVFTPEREGKASKDRANQDRKTILSWWDDSAQELILPERARHFLAYGVTPVIVRPDHKLQQPRWHVRSPLTTYPAPSGRAQDYCPTDCIFAFQRTWAWLQAGGYAERARGLTRATETTPDTLFDILEYVDAENIVLVALGRHQDNQWPSVGLERAVELERIPNRAGRCTAVVPGRITLDKPMGQFEGIIGMYWLQAMLMALEVIAAKKGVFTELWWRGENGQPPRIIRPANGMAGIHGEVISGTPFERSPQPGFQTNPTIDRIERAERLTGGIPPELGGESSSNIRTGRRGDAVLGAAIDFKLLEMQRIFARSLMEENRLAIAVAKGYWPAKFTGQFATDVHHVKYSMAGADVNNLVISGGQRVGLGTLSKEGFREIDPLVEDPELEADRATAEAIREAFLASIQQLASQPEGPWQPAQFARLEELVVSNRKELYEAVQMIQKEMQEAQAAQPQPGAVEAQPGLSSDQVPTVAEPEGGLGNLATLMSQLGRPAQVGSRVA